MKKIPGNLQKKPGKIMEISWNFVSSKKWEPWNVFELFALTCGRDTEVRLLAAE